MQHGIRALQVLSAYMYISCIGPEGTVHYQRSLLSCTYSYLCKISNSWYKYVKATDDNIQKNPNPFVNIPVHYLLLLIFMLIIPVEVLNIISVSPINVVDNTD
jgi:hypothetical protein